jgi:hypothetical protein
MGININGNIINREEQNNQEVLGHLHSRLNIDDGRIVSGLPMKHGYSVLNTRFPESTNQRLEQRAYS